MTNTCVFSFDNFFSVIKRIVSPLTCIVFQLDKKGIIVSVDGNGFNFIEQTPEELLGRSFVDDYNEVPVVIQAFYKALGGEVVDVDGWSHARFFHLQMLPIRDSKTNDVIGVAGFALDETPKILDASSSNFNNNEQDKDSWFYSCFLELPEAMMLVRHGRVVLCNDAAKKLFQYPKQTVPVGSQIVKLMHQWASNTEKYRKNLTLEEIEEIVKDAEQGNTRQFEQDGLSNDNIIAVKTTIYPIHFRGIPHLLFFSQNITPFLEAQRQEAFINNLFDSIQDGIIYIDRDMKIKKKNKAISKMFPNADYEKLHCYSMFRGNENICNNCPAFQTLQDGLEHSLVEHLESDYWVETTSFPIRQVESNEVIGAILLLRDVTEQRRQSITLEQREKVFEAVMSSSNDGILARSDVPNGNQYNARFAEMFGEYFDDHAAVIASVPSDYEVLRSIAENAYEIQEAYHQLMQTLQPQTGTLRLFNGNVYEWQAIAVDTGLGVSGKTRIWKFHDITEIYRTTEVIRQQKEDYRLLFESMPNGMLLADVIRGVHDEPINYIIADLNPSLAVLFNKNPSELIGCSILDQFKTIKVLSHNFGNHWWKGLDDASFGRSGTFHIYIDEIESPYHELFIFRTQKDQIGILQYDETARIQSEQSLRAMQAAIDHLSEPVLWLDVDGTICYANEAMLKSLKYDSYNPSRNKSFSAHPIGAKIWEFDTQSSPELYMQWVAMLQKNETVHFETIMRNYENTTFPIIAACDFLEYGGKQFIIACYHDLSEQIHNIELEQTARVKSQFLTNMSHELRTPLHGISGCVDLLLNTELSVKQRDTAELIRISGQHLLSIVNAILSFSYLEKGDPELQVVEFDLPKLIDNIMKIMSVQMQTHDLELSCLFVTNIPRYVYGDEDKLRQVLMALLSNALKFTTKGSVRLTVAIESWEDKKAIEYVIRFTIIDTGIGIPQEQLSNLFQSFAQLDISFSKEYGGIGMGLALSHQLIQLMGGKINVASQEQVGSKFWFTVPLVCKKRDLSVPSQNTLYNKMTTIVNDAIDSKTSTENNIDKLTNPETLPTTYAANYDSVKMEELHRQGGGGATILVAEDNRVNQIIVCEILTQAGFEYEIAKNGTEAINLFSEKQFSLILMDCQMPVMDGFEATQKIRELEETKQTKKRVPIVALTANTLPEDKERCLNVGMDEFCSKPVNAQKLIEIIKSQIEKSQLT